MPQNTSFLENASGELQRIPNVRKGFRDASRQPESRHGFKGAAKHHQYEKKFQVQLILPLGQEGMAGALPRLLSLPRYLLGNTLLKDILTHT